MKLRSTFVLVLLLWGLPLPSLTAALSDAQQAPLRHAERHSKKGWVYLHIEGTPQERGFQYGYLLAKEITEAVRTRRVVWEYSSGMDWTWLVLQTKVFFAPKVDAETTAELDSMVEGLRAAGQMGLTRDDLIVHNGFFELAWYWWPEEK
jgi:hypothetical protein